MEIASATRFLSLLDEGAERFTFQMATDVEPKPKPDPLARHCDLALDDLESLEACNSAGAAIWVMVNAGDGNGRSAANVARVRAVFIDGDGQIDLARLLAADIEPHIVTETSPGHLQAFWLVDGLSVEQFAGVQRRIAQQFGTDSICDPCRVMRVPGFRHQKDPSKPFQVRIVHEHQGLPYPAAEVLRVWPPVRAKANGSAGAANGGLPPYPDQAVIDTLLRDPIAAAYWAQKFTVTPAEDRSPSGWDLAFAGYIARTGISRDQVAVYLRAYRAHHAPDKGKQDRPSYIWGTVDLAMADAPDPDDETFDGVDGQQQTSWPDPIDILGAVDLVGWPELTTACIPGPLHRYVTVEAERLSVDPCPVAAHVLAACSSLCSDKWRIKSKRHDKDYLEQARLWVCVVKDVGSRGTAMIRSAFWPIRRIEEQFRQEFQREMAAWAEAQGDKKKGGQDSSKPVQKRLTTQDATVEAAGELLKDGDKYSKITVLCDELSGFLGGFNRYDKGGAARAAWLESYDGGPRMIDRIIRGHSFIPNWSAVFAGNIQPRRLAQLGKSLIDDGLFQRFMTIHTKPADVGVDDDVRKTQLPAVITKRSYTPSEASSR
jgi:hypothetical protein